MHNWHWFTFPVRGLQAFRIAYIHTQNNNTFYVGIKHKTTAVVVATTDIKTVAAATDASAAAIVAAFFTAAFS